MLTTRAEIPAYLTTSEAAKLTGLSTAWFERSRWAGDGPPFIKIGSAVRYPVEELHEWMLAKLQTSTTPGAHRAAVST